MIFFNRKTVGAIGFCLSFLFLQSVQATESNQSIYFKTDNVNGLQTKICIYGECEIFKMAIAVVVQDLNQQPIILEVRYPSGEKKYFNWNERKFLEI